jgi:hypothetical protein
MLGQNLLPFVNEVLGAVHAKLTELAKSGVFREWARTTAETIIRSFAGAAEILAGYFPQAIAAATRATQIMNVAVSGAANGVLVLTNGILGLVWAVNAGGLGIRKLLGIQESLGVSTADVEKRVEDLGATIAANAARMEELGAGIRGSLGALVEPVDTSAFDGVAAKIREGAATITRWANESVAAMHKVGATATAAATKAGDAWETMTYAVNGEERTIRVPKAVQSIWSGTGTPPATAAAASALATPATSAAPATSPAAAAAASASPESFAGNYLKAWENVDTAATRILDGLQAKARAAHSQVVESLYDVIKRRLIEDLVDEAARS